MGIKREENPWKRKESEKEKGRVKEDLGEIERKEVEKWEEEKRREGEAGKNKIRGNFIQFYQSLVVNHSLEIQLLLL